MVENNGLGKGRCGAADRPPQTPARLRGSTAWGK